MWKAQWRVCVCVGRGRVQAADVYPRGLQGVKRHGESWRIRRPIRSGSDVRIRCRATSTLRARFGSGSAISPTLRCSQDVVCLASILDGCWRGIVGWQVASHVPVELVLEALRTVIHSADPAFTSRSV
jgi:transposase InsO family protein